MGKVGKLLRFFFKNNLNTNLLKEKKKDGKHKKKFFYA